MRVGIGFDVHELAAGRPLYLGGVLVPYERGLVGHSDGDVILHAVSDALLGAAGLPDIGHWFPPSDPACEGIASDRILDRARREVEAKGLSVNNVDVMVVAEEPRLGPLFPSMKERMCQILGIVPEKLGLKATTAEGLLLGRGKGDAIAAYAVASLLYRW